MALAACGGDATSVPTPKAKAAPDPAAAMRRLISAAHDGDAAAVRRLLAPGSKATPSDLEALGTFSGRGPRTLYRGGSWAVVTVAGSRTVEGMPTRRAYAAAFRLVGGRWRADLNGKVGIRILGPEPGTKAARVPQVAAELTAGAPLVESGLWVDGQTLDVKGGGTPRHGTIYGGPAKPLAAGAHVAVAYGRAATAGSAVAWSFRV